jgi:hypothetical protein
MILATIPLTAVAQAEDEAAFAQEILAAVQVRSILEDREYCGYIARDPEGRLTATKPRRGKYNSCDLGAPPPFLRVLASYHTHASYDAGSINEIPSLQDLMSDIAARTDGYISTPGGRFWFSDHRAREVRLLCGPGCLPQDPVFRPGKADKVRRRYTEADLQNLMGD